MLVGTKRGKVWPRGWNTTERTTRGAVYAKIVTGEKKTGKGKEKRVVGRGRTSLLAGDTVSLCVRAFQSKYFKMGDLPERTIHKRRSCISLFFVFSIVSLDSS